jgi:hypothetical protein
MNRILSSGEGGRRGRILDMGGGFDRIQTGSCERWAIVHCTLSKLGASHSPCYTVVGELVSKRQGGTR